MKRIGIALPVQKELKSGSRLDVLIPFILAASVHRWQEQLTKGE
jgi:hypothetical protein